MYRLKGLIEATPKRRKLSTSADSQQADVDTDTDTYHEVTIELKREVCDTDDSWILE